MTTKVNAKPSWLPITLVLSLFMLAMGLVTALHHQFNLVLAILPGSIGLIFVSLYWIIDLIVEKPTAASRKNFYYGSGLTLFALFILWFAYLQVPLFHFVCHHFGIDGGVHNHEMDTAKTHIDYTRQINMQFTTTTMRDFPVVIKVDKQQAVWYPGGSYTIAISILNQSKKTQVIHPILSATPERSTLSMHFMEHLPKKLVLAPHARFQKTIHVHLKNDFPKDIKAVAMLFNSSDFTQTKQPAKQTHWREIRARYHPTRL